MRDGQRRSCLTERRRRKRRRGDGRGGWLQVIGGFRRVLSVALSWPFPCQSGWFSLFLGAEKPFVCNLFGMLDVRLNPLLIRRFGVRAPGDPPSKHGAAQPLSVLQRENDNWQIGSLALSS